METNASHRTSDCRSDLIWLAGSGVMLSACPGALYLLLFAWFAQCASVPTDFSLLLFG
ncbi:MAG: hypothetical protein KY468_16050 [Armatimonadetes bacterium]|nr:hypothetical protein [Armatimonadota bacterium]